MAAVLAGMTPAAADTMTIGYAEGKDSGKGVRGPGGGDSEWIEMAIYLPASTVKTLAGNKLTGVNGAVTGKTSLQDLRGWIREELDGENLAEFTLGEENIDKAKAGINKLTFNQAWEVPSDYDKGIYVGFGFRYQHGLYNPNLCAFSDKMPNAYFYRDGTGIWKDYSDRGIACLEAVVEGENLPGVNLRISSATTPEYYITSKDEFPVSFKIHNFGTKTITKFDLKATYSDGSSSVKTAEETVAPNSMKVVDLDFAPGVDLAGDQTVEYTLENIAEGADVDAEDNTFAGKFESVNKDYPRYVLSEEFTTEMCGSCPEATKMLHKLLEKPEYSNVIQVAHHAGYKTDFLTTDFHETYSYMWRSQGQNSAPELCVDRRPVALDGSLSFFPEYDYVVTPKWEARLKEPALVSVNISWAYTDESKDAIKVTVRGEKSISKLCDSPSVNVMILENNIPSKSQSGAGKDWVHDDVSRYVSAEDYWGDALTFDGDNYEYTCEIPLDETWVRDELSIVAYVANHGESNRDKGIMNAGVLKFNPDGEEDPGTDEPGSGIESIGSASYSTVEYIDLTGKKIANPAQGIYIVRKTDASGKVTTGKEIVK